uniref:Cytochrome b5 heme-binding domain-containing protein n=1 Tax=Setaria digitata TaxID=48799 RepID=A0A915Q4L3_9BILA
MLRSGTALQRTLLSYTMVSFGAVTEFGGWDLVIFVFLLYVIYVVFLKKPVKDLRRDEEEDDRVKCLPPMPKRDFTVEQLLLFDGVQNERILMAVCGKVGAYGKLAGHDATRALSKMDLTLVKDTPDDLSDISESDLNTAREWMQSFIYKYPVVGKLLAEGEEPTNYSEEEALS